MTTGGHRRVKKSISARDICRKTKRKACPPPTGNPLRKPANCGPRGWFGLCGDAHLFARLCFFYCMTFTACEVHAHRSPLRHSTWTTIACTDRGQCSYQEDGQTPGESKRAIANAFIRLIVLMKIWYGTTPSLSTEGKTPPT